MLYYIIFEIYILNYIWNIWYLGTIEPNVSQNAFQGCAKLKYVYTTSKYPCKVFGPFEARKDNESNKIPLIALCGGIFIIVWIIILCTVLGRKKNSRNEKNQSFQAIESWMLEDIVFPTKQISWNK